METTYLFLISSAINHFKESEFSLYTQEERFTQTKLTISTIKSKVPNSIVCLFELSENKISDSYSDELRTLTDFYFDFSDDIVIKNLYTNFNKFPDLFKYGKSLFELYGLIQILKKLDDIIDCKIKRVFKISGRYTLNDNFDIKEYESKFLDDKYIAKCIKYSNYEPESNAHFHIYQNKGQLITGLWSFDYSLLYETIITLEKSFKYLQILLTYGDGNDIEHSIYHFIDKTKLIDCDELGLYVIKGMDSDSYNI